MELSSLIKDSTAVDTYTAPGFEGERFSQDFFLDVKGTEVTGPHKLRVVSWQPPTPPVGVVIISHGLHEHALRYYSIAHHLTARGVAVYACDHYAHGKSDGIRGLITDHQALVSDFVEFAQHVHREQQQGDQASPLPMALLAHSLGTLVGILAVRPMLAAGLPLRGVLFSATPLHAGPGASSPFGCQCLYPLSQTKLAASMAGCLASCDPKGPAALILVDAISSDRYERDLVQSDPLQYHKDIMNKTAHQALLLVAAAKEELPHITLPFKCVHGAEDTIAYPSGSEQIFTLAGTPAADKSLDLLEGLRHEVLNEHAEAKASSLVLFGDYLASLLGAPSQQTEAHSGTGGVESVVGIVREEV